jgi:hypothetical protein
MSQVHGVGPTMAVIGVVLIFTGGAIAARSEAGSHPREGAAHWQQSLARFNSRVGKIAGYGAGAGVVVALVGVIIWAL